jgi:uncharacterized alkaline shock family protein YloU
VSIELASDDAPTVELPPEQRGVTDIAGTVIERIAVRSASEVDGVRAVPVSTIRRLLRPGAEHGADAFIASDNSVSLELQVAVEYPRPILTVTEAVRQRVARHVEDMTGMQVGSITITVAELPSGRAPRRRVQ